MQGAISGSLKLKVDTVGITYAMSAIARHSSRVRAALASVSAGLNLGCDRALVARTMQTPAETFFHGSYKGVLCRIDWSQVEILAWALHRVEA